MPSSEVWKYFKKSQQNDLARCDICGKELKLPGGGTTTSLLTHLMSLHNIILKRNGCYDISETILQKESQK